MSKKSYTPNISDIRFEATGNISQISDVESCDAIRSGRLLIITLRIGEIRARVTKLLNERLPLNHSKKDKALNSKISKSLAEKYVENFISGLQDHLILVVDRDCYWTGLNVHVGIPDSPLAKRRFLQSSCLGLNVFPDYCLAQEWMDQFVHLSKYQLTRAELVSLSMYGRTHPTVAFDSFTLGVENVQTMSKIFGCADDDVIKTWVQLVRLGSKL